jgi:hypothetical protein
VPTDNLAPSALMKLRAERLRMPLWYCRGPSFSPRSVNRVGRNIALGVRRRHVPNAVRQRRLQKERRGRRRSSRQGQHSAAVSDGFDGFANRSLCRCLVEAEFHPVAPHAVQYRGEFARDSHERLSRPNSFGQGAAP